MILRFVAEFMDQEAFLEAFDGQIRKGGYFMAGVDAGPDTFMSECLLEFRVGLKPPVEVAARIATIIAGVGVAVLFDGIPSALMQLAQWKHGDDGTGKLEDSTRSDIIAPAAPSDSLASPSAPHPAEADEKRAEAYAGSVFDRVEKMSVAQKMQTALHGDREERFAVLRDVNRSLHLYVLKNPKIGLDEVQFAARMSGISADALKYITEHRDWGSNASVCAAIARNPTAPMTLALRALEKVPMSDLRAIAKGSARMPLMQAARKKLANSGGSY